MTVKGAILLAVLVVLVIFGSILAGSAISFRNECVRMENGIAAQYEQNKNSYDQYFKTVKEMAQVPEIMTNDFRKLYDGVMAGRYGKGGSKAVFQWLKEQNPQLPQEVYVKLQTAIEAGRNRFAADQQMLIDKTREYKNYYQTFPNNIWAKAMGYPGIDLSQYSVVTSDETEKTFKEKKSNPFKLRD